MPAARLLFLTARRARTTPRARLAARRPACHRTNPSRSCHGDIIARARTSCSLLPILPSSHAGVCGGGGRAKHLRVLRVEFNPFDVSRAPAAFFTFASTKNVRAASPKLQLERQLLPKSTVGPATLKLTYVDGATQSCGKGGLNPSQP